MIRVESNEKETRETIDKPNKTKLVLGKYRQNLKKNSQSEQETEKIQNKKLGITAGILPSTLQKQKKKGL